MSQSVYRLYLTVFYLSFLISVTGAFVEYESIGKTLKHRQLMTDSYLEAKRAIFAKQSFTATPLRIDVVREQVDYDCFSKIIRDWEIPYHCHENRPWLSTLQLDFQTFPIVIGLLMLLTPAWIFLLKTWVLWIIGNRKTNED